MILIIHLIKQISNLCSCVDSFAIGCTYQLLYSRHCAFFVKEHIFLVTTVKVAFFTLNVENLGKIATIHSYSSSIQLCNQFSYRTNFLGVIRLLHKTPFSLQKTACKHA